MYKKLFVVLLSSLFFACGPKLPTVNNSSPSVYRESFKQVEKSVPLEEKDAFNLSLNMLAMENMKAYLGHGAIIMNDEEEEKVKKQFHKNLHGKNYKQIMSEADKMMLSKMENAQKQYVEVLQEEGNNLLSFGTEPQFQELIISQNSLTKKQASLTVKNVSKTEIAAFMLGAIDMSETIPFVAVTGIELEQPLQSHKSRVITLELDPSLGWDKFITGKQQVASAKWIVVGIEYTNGKELINEKFLASLDVFLQLRRNYESLLESKKDWRSAFNVDNVAKGFFPL